MKLASLSLSLSLCLLTPTAEAATDVTVHPRIVADYGWFADPPGCSAWGAAVYETWVATGATRRLAVQISAQAPLFDANGVPDPCSVGPARIRYAIGSKQSENWRVSDFVPVAGLPPLSGLFDPCAASIRANSDDFFIVAQTQQAIRGCRLISPAPPGVAYFTPWEIVDQPGGALDKPWVVRGNPDELYVIFLRRDPVGPFRIGRSVDGGENWVFQNALAPPASDPQGALVGIVPRFCAQPFVRGQGPMYIAENRDDSIYDVLVATDKNGPQGQNEGVELDFVRDAQGEAIELMVNLPAGELLNKEPSIIVQWSGISDLRERRIPWILADPTNDDRLYFVYEDTASATGAGADDLNVYLRAITRSQGVWSIGPRIQVDQENVPDACGWLPTAWLPSATIDSFGRVHVLFYSNRVADDACLSSGCEPTEPCCGIGTHGAVYDAWYALSIHDSQTGEITGFGNKNLRTSCEEHPALDSTILETAGFPVFSWYPHEYNGIDLIEVEPEWTIVCMTYSGLLIDDDNSIDPSAIFASKVVVENPQE